MPLHSDIKLGSSQVLRAYSGANLFWEWAGGSGGTIPTSGLNAWYDASVGLYDATSGGSLVTTNGAAIARWEDQSGNGNHLTQSTINNQPTLSTNAKNGKDVVTLDGIDDWLAVAQQISLSELSVFAVYKNTNTNARILDQRGTGNVGTGWQLKPRGLTETWYVQSTGYKFTTTKADDSDWHIVNGTYSNQVLDHYIDGVQSLNISSGGTVGNIQTTKLLHVGTNVNGQNSQFYAGDVAELIIYNRVLSTAERQQVENYLMTKYGLGYEMSFDPADSYDAVTGGNLTTNGV